MHSSDRLKQELANEDILLDAIYQFNVNPKKGIYPLCEYYHIKPTPPLIAHLMHGIEGLSEAKIGEYLTSSGNEEILDCYFNEFELQCDIVTAIRNCFCDEFRMPSDSNRVAFAISSMSRVYFKQNKGIFKTQEDCHTLVYSLILLNSDLNNPQNPRPMTLQQFIDNCRELITPDIMSDSQLKKMYNDIKTNPFNFKTEHSGNFLELSGPTCKGNLKKKTDSWKSFWTEHFFVLANSCLFYFHSDLPQYKDKPLGSIRLVGVTVKKGPSARTITLESNSNIQYTKFKKKRAVPIFTIKRLFLQAPNDKAFHKWLYRIQTSANITATYPSPSSPVSLPSKLFDGSEAAKLQHQSQIYPRDNAGLAAVDLNTNAISSISDLSELQVKTPTSLAECIDMNIPPSTSMPEKIFDPKTLQAFPVPQATDSTSTTATKESDDETQTSNDKIIHDKVDLRAQKIGTGPRKRSLNSIEIRRKSAQVQEDDNDGDVLKKKVKPQIIKDSDDEDVKEITPKFYRSVHLDELLQDKEEKKTSAFNLPTDDSTDLQSCKRKSLSVDHFKESAMLPDNSQTPVLAHDKPKHDKIEKEDVKCKDEKYKDNDFAKDRKKVKDDDNEKYRYQEKENNVKKEKEREKDRDKKKLKDIENDDDQEKERYRYMEKEEKREKKKAKSIEKDNDGENVKNGEKERDRDTEKEKKRQKYLEKEDDIEISREKERYRDKEKEKKKDKYIDYDENTKKGKDREKEKEKKKEKYIEEDNYIEKEKEKKKEKYIEEDNYIEKEKKKKKEKYIEEDNYIEKGKDREKEKYREKDKNEERQKEKKRDRIIENEEYKENGRDKDKEKYREKERERDRNKKKEKYIDNNDDYEKAREKKKDKEKSRESVDNSNEIKEKKPRKSSQYEKDAQGSSPKKSKDTSDK